MLASAPDGPAAKSKSREFVKMSVRFETLQRSTVAFIGAMFATVLLVVASAPHIPLA